MVFNCRIPRVAIVVEKGSSTQEQSHIEGLKGIKSRQAKFHLFTKGLPIETVNWGLHRGRTLWDIGTIRALGVLIRCVIVTFEEDAFTNCLKEGR